MSRRHPRKPKKNTNGKNNTRPEIYTAKWVLEELKDMLKEVQADKGIYFLMELFEKRDYSPQRFSEWCKKFKDDDQISEAIKKIETILEVRIAKGGLTGDLNAHITKFALINKHDWKDKSEVEQRHKGLPSLARLLATTAKRERGEEE